MITLHTYRGHCSVGAHVDTATVAEPAVLGKYPCAGVAEVLTLASSPNKPSLLA